ncbi:MAG: MFS transporter [Thermoplasmata archaeon]|nr:MFS transporter [Thermoplasmata archaeon]
MEHFVSTRPNRLVSRPWLVAFVPINAATSGFGVALPLLILITLHGAWTDVALAAALFNSAVIVASMVWGWVADHFPTRRRLLLLNYLGFGVIYLALGGIHEHGQLPVLYALYTAVGFLAPAGASASNLLILETFPAWERPSAYASFQLMSIVGGIAGLLAGVVWLDAHLALPPFLYVIAALSFASVAAVWWGVQDSLHPKTTAHVALHLDSLSSRVRHIASWKMSFPFFPHRPDRSRQGWVRLRRWVREEAHHELPLILAASFLFNLTSNLFNISYTPYLYAVGLSAASIFVVNLANNTAQAIVYPSSGALTTSSGADRLVHDSTYGRSLGYLAVAGFTLVPLSVVVSYVSNLVAFGVLGAAIAFYSTASGIILFRALEGRDAGTLLGINSALGGIAAIAGAVLSGVLSVFGSFRLVFLISAGGLLVSLPLWSAAAVVYARHHAVPPVAAGPAGAPSGPAKMG